MYVNVVVCGEQIPRSLIYLFSVNYYFVQELLGFFTSLSTKDFIVDIMTNIIVRSNYNSVWMSADTLVAKEIQKNVLEQMITLFVRVRTFSFAKSTRERHRIAKKESRQKIVAY